MLRGNSSMLRGALLLLLAGAAPATAAAPRPEAGRREVSQPLLIWSDDGRIVGRIDVPRPLGLGLGWLSARVGWL